MKDRLWQAVYNLLYPLLHGGDVVLAPCGDWPTFPCALILYRDLIDTKDCTVLVLHKGLFTSLPKAKLRRIADQWQWIFANEVFVVFSRTEKIKSDVRRTAAIVHCRPLMRFLHSAALRKRRSKIIYVHVPKTGGTSMWASLTRAFPSHVYFPNIQAYLSNPPTLEDYDLIGLHFSPFVVLQSLSEEDLVIGMVRHPTQRFISGVMHSRRKTEDVATFTAAAKAMREMRLSDYLATDFGQLEARLQLITFGTANRQSLETSSEEELLYSALAFSRRENVVLAPSERSHAFTEFLAKRLSFRPGALGRLNANDPAMYAAYLAEFKSAIRLVTSINAREREFYDFICRSFSAIEEDTPLGKGFSRARSWSAPLSGRPCVE
jgi:Sulfotransferase family